ncbi:MAG: Fe-S-containing hydro-lyase [Candidatus Fermentithermobacillus carboniphilus]|uniref:Fe-S-containing hydro-lyase n=1 Tax=Candidatus Fermentithermobacillus carboniphilus TaxID=3085328 RepID=A0AAT9LB27_9FIRM|nr:MAG: Fe-S-containing hydro-lyase [Candidatus Fermentithermobacillus carboniphilus]
MTFESPSSISVRERAWRGAKDVFLPFTGENEKVLYSLRAGEKVLLQGVMYTARDAAHRRLVHSLDEGLEVPVDLRGQVIYYAGPCPAKPGTVIGSLGPTTSGRMDRYAPRLIEAGLKGMVGKGIRSLAVIEAMVKHGAVYFVTVGGAGALLSKCVSKAEVVAYEDLGPEAIYRLEVVDFPAIVGVDSRGNDVYREAL